MKDSHDNEMALPARRGRPRTGMAKTAAERKREQRERDRTRRIQDWTMETLLQAIATATLKGDVPALAGGCAELKRRAELIANK